MKQFRLLLLLALLLTAATGAWAEEQVVYTLDGTQTASNTAYATAGVVNQGGITWTVTGNVHENPWRIGGKSLSGVDRPVLSENALDGTVTKVTLEFGEASSITVNSITMTVASDDGFSDVIDTKAVIFSANNKVDVTPTEGKEWKNAYYRFVFNVTVSGGTNKYFQLKSIKFYNDPDAQQQGGSSTEPVAGTFTVSLKDGVKDAGNWSIVPKEGLSEGDQVTIQYTGRLKVKGVKATSDAPAKPAATVTTAPTATTGDIVAGSETALVSGGTATGGTMMYKVTTANTKPTSTEGFSDAVPTAKTLEAGTYYVWYYVKADADHANSEISATAIAVTVKAVEGHALSAAAVGEIVGSDGKAYAAANKDNLPEGVEAVAMIWYVNGTHGLALALADEADDEKVMYDWETANTLCNAHTPAITGATWKLATQDDWNNMITGAGGAAALRDGFSSVVGENLQNSPYWSSTNYEWDGYAMHYKFNDFRWEENGKEYDDFVRACLSW